MSLSCEQILPAADASSIVAPGVVEQPAVTSVYSSTPVTSAVFNLGALFCEWGNMPKAAFWNSQAEYRGASLKIVPVSAEQWEAYGPEAGIENPDYPGVMVSVPNEDLWSWCWAADEDNANMACYIEGIVNGYWVSFESTGLNDNVPLTTQELHTHFRPVLDRIVAGLNQQTLPPQWAGNGAEPPLPTDCSNYLSVEQGEELTGLDVSAIGRYWDGPRRGLVWMAMQDELAVTCDLMLVESEGTAARVSAMNQGSWRVNELNSAHSADGSAVAVELAGLGANETSAMRCSDDRETCAIDMSYNGHWVQVLVDPTGLSSGGLDHTAGRENIVQIAEAVLANLDAAN